MSDAVEGITHSLCTLEFADHRPLYDWAVDRLRPSGLLAVAPLVPAGTPSPLPDPNDLARPRPPPERATQIEFSRLNLQVSPPSPSPSLIFLSLLPASPLEELNPPTP